MAEKIDMSLDEIIKRDKISTNRGRRGIGKFLARAQNQRGRKMNIKKVGATARQMKSGPKRLARQTRKLPEKWTHDKFGSTDVASSTLMISNLHYGVTDQDIRDLFSDIGQLKKYAVHYDVSGRSLGKAEVIFFKVSDSIKALQKYNGVPLDGRPMKIQPVVNSTKPIGLRIGALNSVKKNPNGRAKRVPIRARRGFRKVVGQRAGRGGGAGQKMPTAAELDADLDAYNTN